MPEPFILVTHSMGGLLARAAFTTPGSGLLQRVQGVVHLCQPCYGAPVLYRRMFTGCQAGADGNTVADRLFCQILGTSGPQFATNLCGLPGALQLLPTAEHEYPPGTKLARWSGAPGHFVAELYGHRACPPGLQPPRASAYVASNLSANLARVSAFQDRIRDVFHPNTWFLYGTSLLTDVAVFSEGSSVAPVRLEAGDGTVPHFSAAPKAQAPVPFAELAAAPDKHRYGFQDQMDHATACCHPNVAQTVLAIANHLSS